MNLFKNASIYFVTNLITKGASFLIVPLYTSLLGTEDFGIRSAMATFGSILIIINTLAIERSIYRLYWDYITEEEQKKFLGTLFISISCSSLIVLGLVFCFDFVFQRFFSSIPFYPFFALVIFKIFFQSFYYLPKIYYQVIGEAKTYAFLNLLEIFVEIGFSFFFVIYFKRGVESLLQGSLVAMVVISPVFLYFTSKIIRLTFEKDIFKRVIAYSLPIIPSLISAWVLNLSDRILIEKFINVSYVGIYSLGYQLGGAILILTSAFFVAYNPYFFNKATTVDNVAAKQELSRINDLFTVVVIVISSILCLFSEEMFKIFFPPAFQKASYVFSLVCIANIFFQVSGLYNLAFHQKKKTKELFYVTLASAVINLGLNVLLIPTFSIYGAAISTLLSFIIMLGITYCLSLKYYSILINWRMFLGTLLGFTVPCYLISLIKSQNLILSISLKLVFSIFALWYFKKNIDLDFLKRLRKPGLN
jgi:O-antigen/teichoic acid export membrane protein